MPSDILIYGANGYTAELITARALNDGARPILAGRTPDRIAPLAQRHGLPMRAFALDDAAVAARSLDGVGVVLNCAGPFSRTAQAMAQACLGAKAHYLDITGEVEVFEALMKLDAQGQKQGVMLMPGTGFDVVPSDCLAAHLKRRLPDATSLTLAFQAIGQPSHGTAKTMAENLHKGGYIRRGGKLQAVPPVWATRQIDFGSGPVSTMGVPWGDVATAWFSTAIPDIDVFMAMPPAAIMGARLTRYAGALLGSSLVQKLLRKAIEAAPAGPDAAQRARGAAHLWGEVRNAAGQTASSRLHTVDGYALTAMTAWDIAKRAAAGGARAGFQTPSLLFGADYILGFEGSRREDL
jgi:short subunit dehydrogenase-like uncharacterized protein